MKKYCLYKYSDSRSESIGFVSGYKSVGGEVIDVEFALDLNHIRRLSLEEIDRIVDSGKVKNYHIFEW